MHALTALTATAADLVEAQFRHSDEPEPPVAVPEHRRVWRWRAAAAGALARAAAGIAPAGHRLAV